MISSVNHPESLTRLCALRRWPLIFVFRWRGVDVGGGTWSCWGELAEAGVACGFRGLGRTREGSRG